MNDYTEQDLRAILFKAEMVLHSPFSLREEKQEAEIFIAIVKKELAKRGLTEVY